MESPRFHLAIPCYDIKEAKDFYESLGLAIGRLDDRFLIVDFCGSQLVCHKVTETKAKQVGVYPRHFGLVVNEEDFIKIRKNIKAIGIKTKHSMTRYKDLPEEHKTFFIQDPSRNWIEFKTYKNENMI